MKPFKRGMVVDVNLDPTQGSETGKTRPCVIVTNDTYNARVPVIQVVPITAWSQKKGRIVRSGVKRWRGGSPRNWKATQT
ncbi:MAG: type II toxin-antitoxin system PemK/MazF family toxin [Bacteroidetes bacterium]|nr:type II toxin-antitoxin system PemK/MazF family toxin [Bacteroidota bacterium]